MSEKTKILEKPSRERDALTVEEKEIVARTLSHRLNAYTKGQTLVVNQAQSLGASDSAHDVFFIQPELRDRANKRLIFGCKRFRRLESAEHELGSMRIAQERGFTTLQPVGNGVFPIEPLGHVLVTKHMPRLVTMNHLGWSDFFVGKEEYRRRIATPLQQIGAFTAQMHSAGIIHGDFQLKNIGQGQSGDPVLFDMEDAIFRDEDSLDEIDFISYVGEEISVLVSSLVDRGFLWHSTDHVFREELTGNLMDPYLANTSITDPILLDFMQRSIDNALLDRQHLHTAFAGTNGLPS